MSPEHYLLMGLLGAVTGFLIFLIAGHINDEINLYDLVRGDTNGKADGRKTVRIVALIASTIGYMYCIAKQVEVIWMTAVYLSVWVTHDLLGILAQAKGFAITAKAKDGV